MSMLLLSRRDCRSQSVLSLHQSLRVPSKLTKFHPRGLDYGWVKCWRIPKNLDAGDFFVDGSSFIKNFLYLLRPWWERLSGFRIRNVSSGKNCRSMAETAGDCTLISEDQLVLSPPSLRLRSLVLNPRSKCSLGSSLHQIQLFRVRFPVRFWSAFSYSSRGLISFTGSERKWLWGVK